MGNPGGEPWWGTPAAGLACRVASVHQVVAARDERGVVGGEEGHQVRHLLGGAESPQGVQGGYLGLGLGGEVLLQQGRGDEAGAHGVDADALGGVLSRAAALVRPTTPCLAAT